MTVKVDTSEVDAFIKKAFFTKAEMLIMEKPMALTVVNTQRTLVPKDSHATELSVAPDIQSATPLKVIDHIGPSTDYAPFVEFGVASKPNYPIQPFVRPSAMGAGAQLVFKVAAAAFKKMVFRKHG